MSLIGDIGRERVKKENTSASTCLLIAGSRTCPCKHALSLTLVADEHSLWFKVLINEKRVKID
jgi:hypothetical protein